MSVIKSVGRHLGRRGAFLLAMGLAWVCYGVAILTAPAPVAQVEGLTIVTSFVPLHSLAWVWVTAGVIGVAFCAVRRVGSDQLGFTSIVLPPALWAAGYFIDWAVVGEYSRGWVVASTYAAIAASTVIASGWPEIRKVNRE